MTPPRRRPAPRARRPGRGGDQVEGRQAVAELLAARRRRVHDVWMAGDAQPAEVLDRITRLAAAAGVPVRRVSGSHLSGEARTSAPQGVLAHAAPLPDADLGELLHPEGGRAPFLLALDGVSDPQNLGALVRTAEAAGVTGVLLPRHRAARITPAAAKAAAGAVEWVPIASVAGMQSALARATDAGLQLVGLDPQGAGSLFDLDLEPDDGVVVVLGAEGTGMSPLVRRRCTVVVSIPLKGALQSLNVSAAGALALFEIAHRRPTR